MLARLPAAEGSRTLQDIRAITLDLDDTLWAIAPVIRAAESELWDWLAEHYPAIAETFTPERVAALRQRVVQDYWHRNHDFRYLRKKVLSFMAIESGYSDDLVEDAFAVFDRARNRVQLYPDVRSALGRLAERYRIVALTNGNANLSVIGIRHLFDEVVTATDVGVAKPARGIFSAALAHAGVAAEHALHVGDHPEIDVVGAAQAGLRTAWMNRADDTWPVQLPPPDVTVRSLAEVCDALERASDRPPRTS